MNKHIFSKSKKSRAATIKYILNEDKLNEFENADFTETEASILIKKGDIAVIKSQDDYPYYLLKMLKDPFEVETFLKGDYNHEFPPYQRVTWKLTWKFIGSYLEAYKTTKDDKYLPQ